MNRIRDALRDHLLLIVACAMLLNGFLQVQVARQSVEVQRQQREFMKQWAEAVQYIAHWQGPTQLREETTIDGKVASLTLQEARANQDVDILIERMRVGLQRFSEVPNAR